MSRESSPRLNPRARRRALVLGYYNGVLWSMGNGLTSGALLVFLARDLGATGLALSLVLAAPTALGALQLVAPRWMAQRGTARRACLESLALSYVLLAIVPLALAAAESPGPWLLRACIGLICAHQLLEAVGTVALWSWLADLVPRRVRGRYFGRRQVYQLALLIPTLLISGWLVDRWNQAHPERRLVGYATATGIGASLLIASLFPLARIPATRRIVLEFTAAGDALRRLLAPLSDARYRWLIAYACWLSLANGVTQVAQGVFPREVLGLQLLPLALARTGMRLGQMGMAAWAGPFSDRHGNRPTLILAQTLVACGPLCYLVATFDPRHGLFWIVAAYLLWSAYAAINVCRPNLMLRLAPSTDNAPYFALLLACSSLTYAASTVLGGWWFDFLAQRETFVLGAWTVDHYQVQFTIGWIARLAAVLLLIPIAEPGARRWAQILFARRSPSTLSP